MYTQSGSKSTDFLPFSQTLNTNPPVDEDLFIEEPMLVSSSLTCRSSSTSPIRTTSDPINVPKEIDRLNTLTSSVFKPPRTGLFASLSSPS
ncbi:UNVERIFIED_CONTAM: hypothetical protein Sradi_3329500 [Sesamum radiatum]|uniref:Uncharacterized protein n=1 Tax=Sesamum radiatum TaxID=300843 RepID=A0AAW2R2V7_SESRA